MVLKMGYIILFFFNIEMHSYDKYIQLKSSSKYILRYPCLHLFTHNSFYEGNLVQSLPCSSCYSYQKSSNSNSSDWFICQIWTTYFLNISSTCFHSNVAYCSSLVIYCKLDIFYILCIVIDIGIALSIGCSSSLMA